MLKKITISAIIFFATMSHNAPAEETTPSPKSWKFPQVVESARKRTPKNIEGRPFNQFGLAYSSEELSNLDFSRMTAEEMQVYADIVTHAYPDAIAERSPVSCNSIPIENLNETSIAGIAYIAINASKEKNRKWADECLSVLQKKLKEK